MTMILDAKQIQQIPKEFLPAVVFSDNLWSWISFRIKLHKLDFYSHAMLLESAMGLVSQDKILQRRPLLDFLKGKHRVKIWRNKSWSPKQREKAMGFIKEQLQRKDLRYDQLSILGRLLRLKFLQWKNRRDCCEHVSEFLFSMDPLFTFLRPTPGQINRWLQTQKDWEVWAVYDPGI